MYNEQIEALISAALADGMLTEKEKQVLFKKAQSQGIDLDEFEIVLDARLVELEKAEKEKAAASAPKSTKYGDVRKCPVCGAMVPALAGTCPECGYEFSGIAANSSSKQLAEMLLTAEKELAEEERKELDNSPKNVRTSLTSLVDGGESAKMQYQQQVQLRYRRKLAQRQRTIIETFAIPNTKADLFEFITSMEPKLSGNKLSSSYRKKMNECLNKAQMLYPNEPIFVQLNKKVQEHLQKKVKTIMLTVLGVVILLFLAIGLPIILHPKTPDKNAKVCIKMVEQSINIGDYQSAADLIYAYQKSASRIESAYKLAINKAVDNYDRDMVNSLISNYMRSEEVIPKRFFYTSLVNVGDYERAEEFLDLPESSFWSGNKDRNEAYFKHLSTCVTHMCANKDKKKARQYIASKITFYNDEKRKLDVTNEPNPWYPQNVKARLEEIIKNY